MSSSQNYPYTERSLPEALGISEAFIQFQENLSEAAKVDRPVLIIGERGTGKELAAARLHYLSARWQAPLVALNCAALAESVLESELFGHEAGAFTGATTRRQGRFEAAEGGTLFLDEIGLTSITVQEKVLRAVEYGAFERVGSSQPIQVDVRIVGATNLNLLAMSKEGKFKEDLLDRLSFEVLYLPPLRARQDDIAYLGQHFAASMAHELGLDFIPEFTISALKTLESYPWPGNVRELKNVIERSVYRSPKRKIDRIVFDPFRNPFDVPSTDDAGSSASEADRDAPSPLPLLDEVKRLEIRRLKEALRAAQHKQTEAAALLGLTYHQFRGLYRKHKDAL